MKIHPNLPYAQLVDTEDLTGIGKDTPFDWSYWDGQAYQDIGTWNCETLGGPGTCTARGGASLEKSQPVIQGDLSAEQSTILDKAADEFAAVESSGSTYMYGGTASTPAPDLTISDMSVKINIRK